MNEVMYKVLKAGRKITRKIYEANEPPYLGAQYEGQEASDRIQAEMLAAKPSMICRFGSNELNCMATYHNITRHPNDVVGFLKGNIDFLGWDKLALEYMHYVAGFFPITPEMLGKFTLLMVEDMKQIDILGSWCKQERFFNKELAHATRVRLPDLEPYYHGNPWSVALEGRKVLVIHPFEESIKQQYQKRRLLFKDTRVLPDFELKTYKSVQSLANSKTAFRTWFDALEHMKAGVEKIEFDVAIMGCGAYGFPLAAHVKRMGRKAIHLGGATQILFGIKGKRWESHPDVASLWNEHWSRPLPSEVPTGSEKVEGGAYW